MSVRNSFLDPMATLQPVGGFMNLSAGRDQCFVRLRLFILSHLERQWSTSVLGIVCYLLGQKTDRIQVFTCACFQTYRIA